MGRPLEKNEYVLETERAIAVQEAEEKKGESDYQSAESLRQRLRDELKDAETVDDIVKLSRLLGDLSGWLREDGPTQLEKMPNRELAELIRDVVIPELRAYGVVITVEEAADHLARGAESGSWFGDDACVRCRKRPYKLKNRRLCLTCNVNVRRAGELQRWPERWKKKSGTASS